MQGEQSIPVYVYIGRCIGKVHIRGKVYGIHIYTSHVQTNRSGKLAIHNIIYWGIAGRLGTAKVNNGRIFKMNIHRIQSVCMYNIKYLYKIDENILFQRFTQFFLHSSPIRIFARIFQRLMAYACKCQIGTLYSLCIENRIGYIGV